MYDIIILRNGEISIKKRNKAEFENALVKNIKYRVYKNKALKVQKANGRIEILLNGQDENEVMENIKESGYENLIMTVKELVEAEIGRDKKASFKIAVKRIDKSFDMKSTQMSRDIGAKILKAFDNLHVDVINPEYEIHCEYRKNENIVFFKKVLGEGGMPKGVNGRSCVLISGGIDSPVATYLMARRGLFIEAVHYQ